MLATTRYAVTMPGAPGGHAPPEVIVVRITAETGPRGEPVYADASGRYRFSITGSTARLLPGAVKSRACHRCLHAVPLA
jgi:uncharacterized protein DUF6296